MGLLGRKLIGLLAMEAVLSGSLMLEAVGTLVEIAELSLVIRERI